MRVLIVEDDSAIAANLYDFLERQGHRCDYAASLAAARTLLAESDFDAMVLDRSLPDGDGATLSRALRAKGKRLPILMLTARAALEDKLDGFDAGADDYLVKPFALREVEARLLALERRAAERPAAAALELGGLRYDPASCSASLHGVALRLPPKALRLLEVLLRQPGRVLSRREIETAVWGIEQDSSDNLRSLLHTVRNAMGEESDPEIVNVHGLGYKLARR